jgi:hypothetical protein
MAKNNIVDCRKIHHHPPKDIIEITQNAIELWKQNADKLGISERIVSSTVKDFRVFL